MSFDWIQLVGLLVQCLLFLGLVAYTIETLRIRKAAQAQVEALQTPCVTFDSIPRDFTEAVLEANGIQGTMNLRFQEGVAVVVNIGNGPALNVSYALEPMEAPAGANVARPKGYIHSIAPGKVVLSPVSRGVIQIHRFQVTFKYESLSGRKYETKLVLDSLVLTPPFQFIRP